MFQNQIEDIALNKLLILYAVYTSPNKINNESLTELIMIINDTNYFQIQQYISELVNNNMISVDNRNNNYKIHDKGIEALEHFSLKIPPRIIEKLNKEFKLDKDGQPLTIEVEATTYIKDNGEYNVNLKLIEKSDTIFSLYISVPNKSQGEELCKLWEESPDYYYKSIIDLFIKS